MAVTTILAPNGSKIYIQYDDQQYDKQEENNGLRARGANPTSDIAQRTEKFKESLVTTINGYSQILLDSLQDSVNGLFPPNKVTLEFGLQIGGETGIPFVTKGTAQANVKVTIEWDLNNKRQNPNNSQ